MLIYSYTAINRSGNLKKQEIIQNAIHIPTGQLVFSHNFRFSNFHEFQYITVYQYIYTVS